jgi:membrane-bound serine protease (ClpP class)
MKIHRIKQSSFINSLLVVFLILISILSQAQSRKSTIYCFKIDDEIAKPVWLKTRKALDEATRLRADYVIVHLNTYGGALDMADSIRTAILNYPKPVLVFIDNNAASAGALISIACDSIYMRKGANIGAATVVNQTGEQLPDKYQSYMRSIMRSTATATHRNPDIAQAMVDPRIQVPGVNDSGQVVTLTTGEALKVGYCNAETESIPAVLKAAGIKEYSIYNQQLTIADKMIGFLTKPFIAGILIMIIIGGIYFEFQSPGAIFPIAASIVAALLYFAPHYLDGLAANWEIIVFVVGVILLAVEIFAIPGFGVAGISGITLMILGLTLAMVDNLFFQFAPGSGSKLINAFFLVIFAFFLSVVGSIYATNKLFGGKTFFGELSLFTTQKSTEGFTSAVNEMKELTGAAGYAHTMLRPAGKVMINNNLYDATALSGFISKGEQIEVVKYEASQLVVKKS